VLMAGTHTGSGSTSLLDMCTASGGGPSGQLSLFFSLASMSSPLTLSSMAAGCHNPVPCLWLSGADWHTIHMSTITLMYNSPQHPSLVKPAWHTAAAAAASLPASLPAWHTASSSSRAASRVLPGCAQPWSHALWDCCASRIVQGFAEWRPDSSCTAHASKLSISEGSANNQITQAAGAVAR